MLQINPLSKLGFLNWVKKQDPDKTFNAYCGSNCAIAQYAKHLGYEDVEAAYTGFGTLDKTGKYRHYEIEGLNGLEIVTTDYLKSAFGNTFGNLARVLEEA